MNPDHNQNASFWSRLLASLIDTSLFFLLHAFFWQFMAQSTSAANLMYNLLIYLLVIFSPLGLIYTVLLPYYFGATPGKLITGLKITSRHNSPISFKKMFFRQTIGYMFSATFFGLGYLATLKHPDKLAWHDEASGSKVITTGNYWYLGLIALIISIGLSVTFIFQTLTNIAKNNPLQTDIRNIYREVSYQIKEAEKSQLPQDQVNPEFGRKQVAVYDLLRQNKIEDAEITAKELLVNTNNDFEKAVAHLTIGDVYLTKGDNSSAKQSYETSLELKSDLPGSMGGLASVYLNEKDYQKSRELAEKAVAMHPDIPGYNYTLGIALVYLGDRDKGIYYLEKTLELDPDNENAKQAVDWAKNQ